MLAGGQRKGALGTNGFKQEIDCRTSLSINIYLKVNFHNRPDYFKK